MHTVTLLLLLAAVAFTIRDRRAYRRASTEQMHVDQRWRSPHHQTSGAPAHRSPSLPVGRSVEQYAADGIQQAQVLLAQEARKRRDRPSNT